MIHVRDLTKDYTFTRRQSILSRRSVRVVHAVKGLSFEIEDGEKVGLIGLNGSGKSTTIKMLTGILTPTSGELEVGGFSPQKREKSYLNQIGIAMGQRSCLFFDIPVKKSFEYYKEVYRIPDQVYLDRIEEFDQILDIKKLLDTPVRKLSFGQRMKAELVCAMLHLPRILFLDEPTVGLDAVTKENIFRFLNEINVRYHCTILLTTHELENIEKYCSRILVLKQGELVYDGCIDGFGDMGRYRKFCGTKEDYKRLGFQVPSAVETERGMEFIVEVGTEAYDFLIKKLMTSDLTVGKLSLEDIIKAMEREPDETD